jgi:hypothetical protein
MSACFCVGFAKPTHEAANSYLRNARNTARVFVKEHKIVEVSIRRLFKKKGGL